MKLDELERKIIVRAPTCIADSRHIFVLHSVGGVSDSVWRSVG
jgi:hypothetical protein